MTWLVLWLEVMGLMAVVFATGIGIGFLMSWLLRRGQRRKVVARRAPVAAPPPTPTESYVASAAVTTAAPDLEPAPFAVTAAVADAGHTKAPEAIAPAPSVEPSLQVVPYGPITASMRFPLNSFGGISITRPDPDQSSN